MKLKIGVAQGSVLSAPEFSLFINDIFNLNLKGSLQLYADDAVIMFASPNITQLIEHMQHDINELKIWLLTNKLELNIQKSNYMIFDKYKICT